MAFRCLDELVPRPGRDTCPGRPWRLSRPHAGPRFCRAKRMLHVVSRNLRARIGGCSQGGAGGPTKVNAKGDRDLGWSFEPAQKKDLSAEDKPT